MRSVAASPPSAWLGAALLFGVEVGGHIFHEGGGQQRLHVDEAQRAAGKLASIPAPRPSPLRRVGLVGKVNCEQNLSIHGLFSPRDMVITLFNWSGPIGHCSYTTLPL